MHHLGLISGDAVCAQTHQFPVQLLVIGRDGTALTAGDGLDRVEAEGGHICHTAHGASLVFRADGVCRIFDENKVMLLADSANLILFHRLSGKIYRYHTLGRRSDQLLDLPGVDIAGIRFDIRKHRGCAAVQHTVGGCGEGDGADNDLIPGAKACRKRRKVKGCGTV